MPRRRTRRRQRVEVVSRGQLGGLDGELRRRSADHDGEVIRRAGCRAERLQLLEQPRQQRLLVEQRLGLLEQVRLVGAAAALGDEQELVGVAVDGADLDLRRQVGTGVAFLEHRHRGHLAVAKVGREVRLLDPGGDRRFVAAARHHELALLGLDDRRAGVLAHRQHAAGGDGGVLEQVESDEAVVVRRLRVIEDVAQLFEMRRAQEVGDVAHRLGGERADRRTADPQEGPEGCLHGVDAVSGEQSVLRVVRTERQQFGVVG